MSVEIIVRHVMIDCGPTYDENIVAAVLGALGVTEPPQAPT